MGRGMGHYARALRDEGHGIQFARLRAGASLSGDLTVLRPAGEPFSQKGGLRVLAGNLGEAVVKRCPPCAGTSRDHRTGACVRYPGRRDRCVQGKPLRTRRSGRRSLSGAARLRHAELHQLTPALSVLLDRGIKVALVTDGRMSGASGRLPPRFTSRRSRRRRRTARVRDGDIVTVDCENRAHARGACRR